MPGVGYPHRRSSNGSPIPSTVMIGESSGNSRSPNAASTASWWFRSVIVRVMYWSAILLPVLYIPILLTRLHTTEELLLFLGLFGLHVVALIGGRSYRPEANT